MIHWTMIQQIYLLNCDETCNGSIIVNLRKFRLVKCDVISQVKLRD